MRQQHRPDGGGSDQEQQERTTLEIPDAEQALASIDAVLKREAIKKAAQQQKLRQRKSCCFD